MWMWQKTKYRPLLAGFTVAYILSQLVEFPISTYVAVEHGVDFLQLLPQCTPTFIGGVVAAFLAKKRGWQYGIAIAASIEIVYLVICILGIISAEATEWTIGTYLLRMHPWWLSALRILTGAVGGHLGQLLLQKWHKRSEQNVDASQSEH
ncbi:MAG: YrzE family protein [candidate division WOR-3 bacterium]|nr:MAG: YrzE family protein [candidate division WOR-3 bacterium]